MGENRNLRSRFKSRIETFANILIFY